jgi:phospholipase/carboxylesterase
MLGADVRLDVVPRAVHQLAPPLLDRVLEALCSPPETINMAS